MTTTRFAPSPTGHIHVGNLRTALMNFLIARKAGGTFILRIDDTDPERSKEAYVDAIKHDLDWLGLHWDRVERQSQRLDRYAEAADRLRDMGRFYEAFETPTELDLKRKKQLNMGRPPVYDRAALSLSEEEKAALRAERGDGVWRFRLDHERIVWQDGILGEVSIDAASVSDPVLIRGDGQHRAAIRASLAADRAARRGAVEASWHAVLARPARAGGGADGASEPDGAAGLCRSGGIAQRHGRTDRGVRHRAFRRGTDQVRRGRPFPAHRADRRGPAL